MRSRIVYSEFTCLKYISTYVFFVIVKIFTKKLGKYADIDIIEMHDSKKQDVPSGAAKEIASINLGQ